MSFIDRKRLEKSCKKNAFEALSTETSGNQWWLLYVWSTWGGKSEHWGLIEVLNLLMNKLMLTFSTCYHLTGCSNNSSGFPAKTNLSIKAPEIQNFGHECQWQHQPVPVTCFPPSRRNTALTSAWPPQQNSLPFIPSSAFNLFTLFPQLPYL